MTLWLVSTAGAGVEKRGAASMLGGGIPVEVVPADIDERAIEKNMAASEPKDVALLLAREKAKAIAAKMPGGSCSAPTRHCRLARSAFPNRPTATRRAASF